jgi:uncharacterized membrane protein YsdA (DUF1294 family)
MYFLIALGATIFLAAAVRFRLSGSILVSWLAAINLVSLLIFWYDKRVAGSERRRVPERVLLALALLGGTLGAVAGMVWFRHKTAKVSFKRKLWLVVVLQVLLLIGYWLWVRPVLAGTGWSLWQ